MTTLNDKTARLKSILTQAGPPLVAFSGGLDSTLLLYFAAQVHPGLTLALTVRSPFQSPQDESDLPLVISSLLKQGLAFRHETIDFDPLTDQAVAANTSDRCYLCKKKLADLWRARAARENLAVIEGSQADDLKAVRPGGRAVKEAGICSPLAEAGLTKTEVRELTAKLGLYAPQRASQACLASRVPYGQALSPHLLEKIAGAEIVLAELGFGGARARVAGNLLRLELWPQHLEALDEQNGWPDFRRSVNARLGKAGWDFITLDMNGYKSGCFD